MKKQKICCCSPKTWTRVIGGIHMVQALLLALTGVAVATQELPRSESYEKAKNDEQAVTFQAVRGRIIFFLVTLLTFVGCHCLFSALLLMGNEKERTGFFLPWIIFNWFKLVCLGLFFSLLLSTQGICLLALALAAVSICEEFLLFVVHQRWAEIKAAQEKKRTAEHGFMAL